MIGKPPNTGIVPRVTEEMFVRVGKSKSDTKQYEVTFSMLEVYNEKVRDLLVPEEQSPSGGLKVRERPNGECYADGQKDMHVDSYLQIEKWMDYGNKNKTIGATKMNKESSRSHTVITVKFKQIELVNGKQSIRSPVINLVDLAGSEKATQTGAEGDRLKEGIAINKSLTTLGMCINILSEKASGKSKKEVVPYRNSVLTRLLQNALGGNSKTIMICALSPASSNYEETLNTLRYAERAKKIELRATVVESAQDKLIRELRDEIERLKMQIVPGSGGSEEAERLKRELTESQQAILEMQKSWEERIQDSKIKQAEAATNVINIGPIADISKPHIMNVSEDPLLTGKIVYTFDKPVLVGKKNGNPLPHIILGSVAIRPNHAKIERVGTDIELFPNDPECMETIFVNGMKITGRIVLKHGDRIIFGTNSAYIYKNPSQALSKDEHDMEYEEIMQEKYDKTDKSTVELVSKKEEEEKQAENEKIRKELEQKIKDTAEAKEAEKQVYQNKLKELEEKVKQEEEEKKQKKLAKKENAEKKSLEERLSKMMPLIKEVNLCAKEFKRNISLDLKLAKELPDWMGKKISDDLKKAQVKLTVQVINKEQGSNYVWSEDKFLDRLEIVRDLINEYFEEGKIPNWTPENDPFWDIPEAELIGQGYLQLKPLAYLFENEVKISLFDSASKNIGFLHTSYKPTDSTGENEPEDAPEDPKEILTKALHFQLNIDKAVGLPRLYREVYCQYKLPYPTQDFATPKVVGPTKDPVFNYSKRHSYDYITETLLNFLLDSSICIKLYGYSDRGEQVQENSKKSEIKTTEIKKKERDGDKKEDDDKAATEFKKESDSKIVNIDKNMVEKEKQQPVTADKSNIL